MESNIKVRVGTPVYSEKSIGALVDVIVGPNESEFTAGRLEWFPKSICQLEIIEKENKIPEYYLTAPIWLLDKNKVKY